MIKSTLAVTNKAGLHARAAAKLVETVARFNSTVEIGTPEKMVDGKSILSIMLLAAAKGTQLDLIVSGDDEEHALKALIELSDNFFGEE